MKASTFVVLLISLLSVEGIFARQQRPCREVYEELTNNEEARRRTERWHVHYDSANSFSDRAMTESRANRKDEAKWCHLVAVNQMTKAMNVGGKQPVLGLRRYGMWFTAYFPQLELSANYYMLAELESDSTQKAEYERLGKENLEAHQAAFKSKKDFESKQRGFLKDKAFKALWDFVSTRANRVAPAVEPAGGDGSA